MTWSHSPHSEHRDASRKHLSFIKDSRSRYANNYTRFIPTEKKTKLTKLTVKSYNLRCGSVRAEVVLLMASQSLQSWRGTHRQILFLNLDSTSTKVHHQSFCEKPNKQLIG